MIFLFVFIPQLMAKTLTISKRQVKNVGSFIQNILESEEYNKVGSLKVREIKKKNIILINTHII